MNVVIACCAGLDVHKKTIAACARRIVGDGQVIEEILNYGTTTAELLALLDWLIKKGVTRVAMESTGVYWKHVYHMLEGHLDVMLVNAHHIKHVPGRKTDVKDAQWIAELLQYGLLAPSFVPPAEIRELRDLTRQRTTLVREKTTVANRVQKVLEDANIKLAGVASDPLGVSGRAMIRGLIAGERDPATLAQRARARLRKRIPQLREALDGRVTEHHRFLLKMLMEQIETPGEADRAVRQPDRHSDGAFGPSRETAGDDPGPGQPGGGGDRVRDRHGHGTVPEWGPPGVVDRDLPGQRPEHREATQRAHDQRELIEDLISRSRDQIPGSRSPGPVLQPLVLWEMVQYRGATVGSVAAARAVDRGGWRLHRRNEAPPGWGIERQETSWDVLP
jgi:hypothetical protein